MSEDCLFLDVYAPARFRGVTPKLLPVYVFIQGGGYNVDGNPYYNAAGLLHASDMNIVVVTFNYRVGPYGFLAASEINEDGSVNNGLKDQIKVLEWVQEHIRKVRTSASYEYYEVDFFSSSGEIQTMWWWAVIVQARPP